MLINENEKWSTCGFSHSSGLCCDIWSAGCSSEGFKFIRQIVNFFVHFLVMDAKWDAGLIGLIDDGRVDNLLGLGALLVL